MRWLIDGYNVIRRDPDLRSREAESLEAGRRALHALVARIARTSPDHFTIVFDGARAGGAAQGGGQVEVVFSRPPASADDVLVRLAARWGNGAVVVTSDRAVGDRARRARCAVLGAEEFHARATAAAGGVAGGEVAEKDTDADDEEAQPKRGNPRRLSKAARAARRALGRLGRP